jgi:two-component SAPR family response regulator
MLRIAALDDENHALERFETVVCEFDDIESCKLFNDEDDLLAWLAENPLDVVFLDIEMPGKSGMQLAEELHEINPDLSVVFVTAFSQYAVEAFELSVSDYLMKPVSKERLRKTLDRINSSKELLSRAAKRVAIHCFPRFECRIEDKVLPLNHLMKAKELLAFLVSRKGTETSWDQITEALWPDTDYEKAHNNLHITTFRLRKWLSENSITQIFEARRNSYRVVATEFNCDLYDLADALKADDRKRIELLYKGEFLEEEGYQWAYPIQAELAMKINNMK